MLRGHRQSSMLATSLAMGLLVASPHPLPQAVGRDAFARLPGVTLHYVDWGGTGPRFAVSDGPRRQRSRFRHSCSAVHGPSAGFGAHAPRPRESDAPESGYHPPTLASDIRAFLDLSGIETATLVGFSAAGSEMNGNFAWRLSTTDRQTRDPARCKRLPQRIRARNKSPTRNTLSRFRIRPVRLGQIVRASRVADPDYTRSRCRLSRFLSSTRRLHPRRCGRRTTRPPPQAMGGIRKAVSAATHRAFRSRYAKGRGD